MPEAYYQDKLYPLQNIVLKIIETAQSDFYLTGGTALSRCYLMHRYSDDLDFFVNAHPEFKEQCKKIISLIKQSGFDFNVSTASENFVRIMIEYAGIVLKIDFVNDVPFRYGQIKRSKIFWRVDNWRNILSNKLCALSRMEPKDIVDILFISKRYEFAWEAAFQEAREKDLWVEPIEICRIINSFDPAWLKTIKWIPSVETDRLVDLIQPLHNDIFYGRANSLAAK